MMSNEYEQATTFQEEIKALIDRYAALSRQNVEKPFEHANLKSQPLFIQAELQLKQLVLRHCQDLHQNNTCLILQFYFEMVKQHNNQNRIDLYMMVHFILMINLENRRKITILPFLKHQLHSLANNHIHKGDLHFLEAQIFSELVKNLDKNNLINIFQLLIFFFKNHQKRNQSYEIFFINGINLYNLIETQEIQKIEFIAKMIKKLIEEQQTSLIENNNSLNSFYFLTFSLLYISKFPLEIFQRYYIKIINKKNLILEYFLSESIQQYFKEILFDQLFTIYIKSSESKTLKDGLVSLLKKILKLNLSVGMLRNIIKKYKIINHNYVYEGMKQPNECKQIILINQMMKEMIKNHATQRNLIKLNRSNSFLRRNIIDLPAVYVMEFKLRSCRTSSCILSIQTNKGNVYDLFIKEEDQNLIFYMPKAQEKSYQTKEFYLKTNYIASYKIYLELFKDKIHVYFSLQNAILRNIQIKQTCLYFTIGSCDSEEKCYHIAIKQLLSFKLYKNMTMNQYQQNQNAQFQQFCLKNVEKYSKKYKKLFSKEEKLETQNIQYETQESFLKLFIKIGGVDVLLIILIDLIESAQENSILDYLELMKLFIEKLNYFNCQIKPEDKNKEIFVQSIKENEKLVKKLICVCQRILSPSKNVQKKINFNYILFIYQFISNEPINIQFKIQFLVNFNLWKRQKILEELFLKEFESKLLENITYRKDFKFSVTNFLIFFFEYFNKSQNCNLEEEKLKNERIMNYCISLCENLISYILESSEIRKLCKFIQFFMEMCQLMLNYINAAYNQINSLKQKHKSVRSKNTDEYIDNYLAKIQSSELKFYLISKLLKRICEQVYNFSMMENSSKLRIDIKFSISPQIASILSLVHSSDKNNIETELKSQISFASMITSTSTAENKSFFLSKIHQNSSKRVKLQALYSCWMLLGMSFQTEYLGMMLTNKHLLDLNQFSNACWQFVFVHQNTSRFAHQDTSHRQDSQKLSSSIEYLCEVFHKKKIQIQYLIKIVEHFINTDQVKYLHKKVIQEIKYLNECLIKQFMREIIEFGIKIKSTLNYNHIKQSKIYYILQQISHTLTKDVSLFPLIADNFVEFYWFLTLKSFYFRPFKKQAKKQKYSTQSIRTVAINSEEQSQIFNDKQEDGYFFNKKTKVEESDFFQFLRKEIQSKSNDEAYRKILNEMQKFDKMLKVESKMKHFESDLQNNHGDLKMDCSSKVVKMYWQVTEHKMKQIKEKYSMHESQKPILPKEWETKSSLNVEIYKRSIFNVEVINRVIEERKKYLAKINMSWNQIETQNSMFWEYFIKEEKTYILSDFVNNLKFRPFIVKKSCHQITEFVENSHSNVKGGRVQEEITKLSSINIHDDEESSNNEGLIKKDKGLIKKDNKNLKYSFKTMYITSEKIYQGILELSNHHSYNSNLSKDEIYFKESQQVDNQLYHRICALVTERRSAFDLMKGLCEFSFKLHQNSQIMLKNHLHEPNSIEIYTDSQTYFFRFENQERRHTFLTTLTKQSANYETKILKIIMNNEDLSIVKHKHVLKWRSGKISNFQYLMRVNDFAGRSFNQISQYYIFPWIVVNYKATSINRQFLEDKDNFRDLTVPIGKCNEKRFKQFEQRYNQAIKNKESSMEPYFYGVFLSNPAVVCNYLIRVDPFTSHHLSLQSGKYDEADRLFYSVENSFKATYINHSDLRELIPEFYFLSEFLRNRSNLNLGVRRCQEKVNNVMLPSWVKTKTPEEFIFKMRKILESKIVTFHLNKWIDLTFGDFTQYSIVTKIPIKANIYNQNVYNTRDSKHSLTLEKQEENFQKLYLKEFGQMPTNIFKRKDISINHIKQHGKSFVNIYQYTTTNAKLPKKSLEEETYEKQISKQLQKLYYTTEQCEYLNLAKEKKMFSIESMNVNKKNKKESTLSKDQRCIVEDKRCTFEDKRCTFEDKRCIVKDKSYDHISITYDFKFIIANNRYCIYAFNIMNSEQEIHSREQLNNVKAYQIIELINRDNINENVLLTIQNDILYAYIVKKKFMSSLYEFYEKKEITQFENLEKVTSIRKMHRTLIFIAGTKLLFYTNSYKHNHQQDTMPNCKQLLKYNFYYDQFTQHMCDVIKLSICQNSNLLISIDESNNVYLLQRSNNTLKVISFFTMEALLFGEKVIEVLLHELNVIIVLGQQNHLIVYNYFGEVIVNTFLKLNGLHKVHGKEQITCICIFNQESSEIIVGTNVGNIFKIDIFDDLAEPDSDEKEGQKMEQGNYKRNNEVKFDRKCKYYPSYLSMVEEESDKSFWKKFESKNELNKGLMNESVIEIKVNRIGRHYELYALFANGYVLNLESKLFMATKLSEVLDREMDD